MKKLTIILIIILLFNLFLFGCENKNTNVITEEETFSTSICTTVEIFEEIIETTEPITSTTIELEIPIETTNIETTSETEIIMPAETTPQVTYPLETQPPVTETTPPTEPPIEETSPTEPIIETTSPTEPSIEETTSSTEPSTEETTPPETIPPIKPENSQYPEATYIWNYLTQTLGYNNYVAAGILGNIMVEVGGYTLNLTAQYSYVSTGGYTYYGMCMWNINYHPEVAGKDLYGQCKYLGDSIAKTINLFGSYYYAPGFNFDSFLSLTDAREAAIAFCKTYEIGAGHTARANCAEIAYNYFVNQTA